MLVTDGRATGGPDPVAGAHRAAALLAAAGVHSVVVDCETGPVRLGLAGALAEALGGVLLRLDELAAGPLADSVRVAQGGALMPQGKPAVVPDDGLTTRQRRNRALVVVHTGEMKGKSTAAFGLALRAWNQGWPIGVFQFVKSAKWKIGEESALRALARVHQQTGEGGPVTWHKMGEGWSWIARPGTEADHAANAQGGLGAGQAGPRRAGVPLLRAGRVHLPDEVGLGRRRGRGRHADGPARPPARGDHRARRRPARWSRRPTWWCEMTKVKHPMDAGQKGQKGIEW